MAKRRQYLPVPRGTSCKCGCSRPAETGYGLSHSCYARWRYHGFPDVVPPPSRFEVGRGVDLAGRLEDYQFIGGPKISSRQAAERLGVTMRTIERYKAALRREEAAA